jgi:aminoglycoside phosphotransferase family enzyme/predicted kinase
MSDPRSPDATDDEAAQAETVAFLEDPATHDGAAVERADTHISRLFLAGDRAWKLKRAISRNFLDFSSPAKREAACRRELEVNRGAGDLYLGVVPVTRGPDGLALGGEGEPVDWLVEMRRFDRAQELDRLAERGALELETIGRLADDLAGLHAQAPAVPGAGGADDAAARIDQIAAALAEAAGQGPLAAEADAWAEAARQAAAAQAATLDARARRGRVRRCHGDLHLGNIVMLEGRAVPFDAIEFNEDIATVDVLHDLAFLLFDLRARGLAPHAAEALSRYMAATRETDGMGLLHLYISLRAAVRAMAAAARGDGEEAARDLSLARQALAPPPPARLLAVGGISGTGKTSLARRLASDLGAPPGALVIRSDVTRKRLAGVAPEDRLPETAYSDRTSARVLTRMMREARRALRAGACVVLDATFLAEDWRACAARLAQAEGVPFQGLWLELPLEAAVDRVEARRGDASDADAQVVRAQAAPPAPPAGWTPLDASGPPETAAARARAALDPGPAA